MSTPVYFNVNGTPIPKQSFRINSNGVHFQTEKVTVWQNIISWGAKIAMQGRDPIAAPVSMTIDFYLPNHSRKDLDNLSKCVLDGCNGIVFVDDNQVVDLELHKHFDSDEYGCTVTVKTA
jgi:Holliday junction resolvase RusA-like endonuclease